MRTFGDKPPSVGFFNVASRPVADCRDLEKQTFDVHSEGRAPLLRALSTVGLESASLFLVLKPIVLLGNND
jgi:hypothetical protein